MYDSLPSDPDSGQLYFPKMLRQEVAPGSSPWTWADHCRTAASCAPRDAQKCQARHPALLDPHSGNQLPCCQEAQAARGGHRVETPHGAELVRPATALLSPARRGPEDSADGSSHQLSSKSSQLSRSETGSSARPGRALCHAACLSCNAASHHPVSAGLLSTRDPGNTLLTEGAPGAGSLAHSRCSVKIGGRSLWNSVGVRVDWWVQKVLGERGGAGLEGKALSGNWHVPFPATKWTTESVDTTALPRGTTVALYIARLLAVAVELLTATPGGQQGQPGPSQPPQSAS